MDIRLLGKYNPRRISYEEAMSINYMVTLTVAHIGFSVQG